MSATVGARPVSAAITNWLTGQPIPDLASYTAGPQVNLDGLNLTEADLRSSNLTQATFRASNLTGASLDNSDLTQADFSNADLSNALMQGTTLSNAIFDGSKINGAVFSHAIDFTESQLKSTASYQAQGQRALWAKWAGAASSDLSGYFAL